MSSLKAMFEAEGFSYEHPGFLSGPETPHGIVTIGIDGESFGDGESSEQDISVQIMTPDGSQMLMGKNFASGAMALPMVKAFNSGKFIEAIGDDFAAILRDWAQDEEFEEMLADNAAESDPGICHSHDFCDANMAMMEAMENFGFKSDELLADIEAMASIWNASWNYAAVKYLGRKAS